MAPNIGCPRLCGLSRAVSLIVVITACLLLPYVMLIFKNKGL
jgi:hypothetical protein